MSVTFWARVNAVVIHISLDELRGFSISAKFVVLIDRRNRAPIVIDVLDKLYSIYYCMFTSLLYITITFDCYRTL